MRLLGVSTVVVAVVVLQTATVGVPGTHAATVPMSMKVSVGLLVQHKGNTGQEIGVAFTQYVASGLMAVQHVNERVNSLVPEAKTLLPEGFTISVDVQDSQSSASLSVAHVFNWNLEGRHVIVGAHRSAVTGPVALVAAIENTPVISWASTSPALSDKLTYSVLSRTVRLTRVFFCLRFCPCSPSTVPDAARKQPCGQHQLVRGA